MRITRSGSQRRKLDEGEKEKLSDAQAMFYMRRLWSVLPEEKNKKSIYIDPGWIRRFVEQPREREKVIRWIARLNVFRTNYAFFPICLWNHWVLIVLCNAGGKLEDSLNCPSMILLNSLEGSNNQSFEKEIRRVLKHLFKNLYPTNNVVDKIALYTPKVPQQDDDKKCGFFVMYYMTLFLWLCPDKFSSTSRYPDFLKNDWFSIPDLDSFRNSLLSIFWRIDDYEIPVRKGHFINGFDNDSDTICVIENSKTHQDTVVTSSDEDIVVVSEKDILDMGDDQSLERDELYEHETNNGSTEVEDSDGVDNDKNASIPLDVKERRLSIKMNPKMFTDVLDNLCAAQKNWVIKTGFGKIFSLNMTSYPPYMGFSLVDSFNHVSCSMTINGEQIPIREDDVNDILGLPNGNRKVEFLKKNSIKKIWRKQYGDKKQHFRVTVRSVANKIKESSKVDKNFKLNFITLLISVIIGCPANSFVRQSILGFAGNIDKCMNYNWCAFLIDYLKKASVYWKRNNRRSNYTGSIAFLVYFFLDQVVRNTNLIEQTVPKCYGWSGFSLEKIESYMMDSDALMEDKLAIPFVDKKVLTSWEVECTDDAAHMDDVEKQGVTTQSNDNVGNMDAVEKEGVTTEGKIALLERTFAEYDSLRDKFLSQLRDASNCEEETERIANLKKSFVDMNDVSNFLAESFFNNSDAANKYVEKLQSRKAKAKVVN